MPKEENKYSDSSDLSDDINREENDHHDFDAENDDVEHDNESDDKPVDGDSEEVNVIPPEISIFDLKTPILQNLFNREFENFERALTHYKKTNDLEDYQNQLEIAFWLSVSEEAFEYAQFIYNLQDSEFFRKICTNLVIKSIKK